MALSLLMMIGPVVSSAQTSLKPILTNITTEQSDKLPDGLEAYANGDYSEAFNTFVSSSSSDMPFREKFVTYSLLYQRDYKLIKEYLESDIYLPEAYRFYIRHPRMEANLDGQTSLDLDNNRFQATIGSDTLTVLLDTGGSGVGINREWVEKYDMPYDTTISTTGVLPFFDNATFKKYPVMIPELTLGDMKLENIPAEYSSFTEEEQAKVEDVGIPEFDIIMGLDTFIGYIGEVEFNWISGTITFRKQPALQDGTPFIFYSSKPFTSYSIDGEYLTTVIDTGSPNDMIEEDFYLNNYTRKEEKTWEQYEYTEYTVDIERSKREPLSLLFRDYTGGINLTIGDEKIEFLVGFNHKNLTLNIEDNILRLN